MNDTLRLLLDHLETPLGTLALVADDAGRLRALGFLEGHSRKDSQLPSYAEKLGGSLSRASDPYGFCSRIHAYFAGDWAAIRGLPVAARGTPFQKSVWRALVEIPCGETRSYGDIARSIGNPAAVRAVGLANGANPIGIVVPCHRVIGANGTLTGYAGGVERKRWLLAHEQRAGQNLELPLATTAAAEMSMLRMSHSG
jgi:methylated-DNA-[protein]-cysteine S-methyltransferase